MSRWICRKAIQLSSSSTFFRYERVVKCVRFASDAAAAAGAARPELSGATPVSRRAPACAQMNCFRSACSPVDSRILSCWTKCECLRCRCSICKSSFCLLHVPHAAARREMPTVWIPLIFPEFRGQTACGRLSGGAPSWHVRQPQRRECCSNTALSSIEADGL